MEWLSTFIFRSVEWLDKTTDKIGNNMGKFFLLLALIFLGLMFWPTKEVPPDQRGVISKEQPQKAEPSLGETITRWLVDHTPSKQ